MSLPPHLGAGIVSQRQGNEGFAHCQLRDHLCYLRSVIGNLVPLEIKDSQLFPVCVVVALDTLNQVLREVDLLEMNVSRERSICNEFVMSGVKQPQI